jgi:carboxymethylenebutenolidase
MTSSSETAWPVSTRTVTLTARDGGRVDAFVAEPVGPGPFPAIAFGPEAMGPNRFTRRTGAEAAALGYVTISPDYYRGEGPSRPDDYSDFTEVMAAIADLDFRQATYDVLAGVDWLRAQANVDASRVAVWGYCTGGTLALLASCLDRTLKATVLFFISQPTFPELTAKRPMQPVDLIWAINPPVLFICGDQDHTLTAEVVADIRARFERWGVRHDIRVYPGAGHAFSAVDAPHMYNAAATAASWEATQAFLAAELSPPIHPGSP